MATKSERAWEHLKDLDVSQPTRTNRRINEPDLEAPPPEPPRQNPNLTAEEPEPDPFELVKEGIVKLMVKAAKQGG